MGTRVGQSASHPTQLEHASSATAASCRSARLREYIRLILRSRSQATALQAWVDGLKTRALVQRFQEEPTSQ